MLVFVAKAAPNCTLWTTESEGGVRVSKAAGRAASPTLPEALRLDKGGSCLSGKS